MVGLVLCSALLLASPENPGETPTQAYAHAIIAEVHIARHEWKPAESALRYALIFDFDNPYLRARLDSVLSQLGKPKLAHSKTTPHKWRKLKLQRRLLGGVAIEPVERDVAEKR